MEVRSGYKQTEVGIIPEHWTVEALEKLCVPGGLVRGPFGGAIKKESFVRDGFKVYEQKNAISGDADLGSYFIDGAKFKELERFEVKAGDFIVSCSGTIGKIFQVPKNARAGIINQALLRIRTDRRAVHDEYFFYAFDWDRFQRRIIDNTQGGAMHNLVGMDVFRNIPVSLPPLPEQRAIAAALSDVDALITSLDRLIAKKRDIKQAAMQQLLTGKTRLPGFTDEWRIRTVGELFEFLNTANNPRSDLTDKGTVKYIHYGDIHTRWTSFLDCATETLPLICEDKVRNTPFLEDGDLVMVDASEDYEGTGVSVEVRNASGRRVVAGLHTLLLRGDRQLLADGFKGYLQYIPSVKGSLREIATGVSVYGISRGNIKNICISLPGLDEQRAIAAVLSDMDAEIAALERRRDKTRALKQGMMQELLTGRIRLV